MKYAKRIVSLLLLLSIIAGSTAALAAEGIVVSETPTVSVASEQAETPNSDIPTQVTAKASKATNDIVINDSSKNQTKVSGVPFTLDFTIKHPTGAPKGRAVIRIVGDDPIVKKITNKSKSSFQVHIPFQKNLDSDTFYWSGTYTVQAYTEIKNHNEWVRSSQIKETTLYIAPNITVTPINYYEEAKKGLFIRCDCLEFGDDLDLYNFSEGYYGTTIYRKTTSSSKWVKLTELSNSEGHYDCSIYNDTNVRNGSLYTYSVKSRIGIGASWSKRSPSISYYFLNRPNKLALTNTNSGKTVKLSWSRNSKVSGYEVRYSLDTDPNHNPYSKNLKARSIVGNKNTSLTLKNRTPGKQYYFQVRGYKTVNNKKYYSAWSDTILRYPD